MLQFLAVAVNRLFQLDFAPSVMLLLYCSTEIQYKVIPDDVPYLANLVVAQSARGQGLGAKMVKVHMQLFVTLITIIVIYTAAAVVVNNHGVCQ
jgi:GNAT superfamily N-acetyltransferase